MSRRLDDLDSEFRSRACELLARLTEAGIPVLIVGTFRTEEEQAENIRKGVSWTTLSRHLIGRAIDVAPYEVYQLHGGDKLQWNSDDPVWEKIGAVGKKLGLLWGGDWRQRDVGHFESRR